MDNPTRQSYPLAPKRYLWSCCNSRPQPIFYRIPPLLHIAEKHPSAIRPNLASNKAHPIRYGEYRAASPNTELASFCHSPTCQRRQCVPSRLSNLFRNRRANARSHHPRSFRRIADIIFGLQQFAHTLGIHQRYKILIGA